MMMMMMMMKVAQSCPTLCDPMDYIVHVILQARILEWVAMLCPWTDVERRDILSVSEPWMREL